MSRPSSSAPPRRYESLLFSRQGLLCVLLLGLCLLATWPVVEIGVNDDWSYIRTAQVFLHTGRFVYNGWATAMLGWQIPWGALFAKIFGASYTAIRLSTVPIALACVPVFRKALRRFGLNEAHASFGTLALVLSPLFLPLADTFMSDIPGLFAILLCIYLCQRACGSADDRRAALWLVAAALSNLFLGSVRQIAWLGVLVIVPSCGWLLRRRRIMVPLTVGLWLAGVVCIRAMMAWFIRQPYSLPEKLLPGTPDVHALKLLVEQVAAAVFTALLFCLPVLAAGLPVAWRNRRRFLLRACLGLVGLVMVYAGLRRLHAAQMIEPPWLVNVVGANGILQSGGLFGSTRSLSGPMMVALFGFFVLCAASFAAALVCGRRDANVSTEGDPGQLPWQLSWRATSTLLLPFFVAYWFLLLPRAAFIVMFDRYMLPVMAVLLVYLLRWHQERVSERLPRAAIVTLALVAFFAVAGTHDFFAMDRARVRAADELLAAGTPRASLRGGFAFDAISQVDAWGYVNDPRLVNPPGSYRPQPANDGPCRYWFQPFVPAVQAKYALATDPTPCLGPSPFAPVSYHTWLPPATRQIFVGTVSPQKP